VGSQVIIRPFQPADEAGVISLWEACDLVKPQNDPRKDIMRKLRVNPEWFLVASSDGRIVGAVMAGYEGHRGWINYLAVDPTRRRSGVGRTLMAEAERALRAAGCPKINLQVRPENKGVVAFYEAIGFSVEGVISLGKRLERNSSQD
jgi:ribosomal protein S18 acetylase RimI-like enzyme